MVYEKHAGNDQAVLGSILKYADVVGFHRCTDKDAVDMLPSARGRWTSGLETFLTYVSRDSGLDLKASLKRRKKGHAESWAQILDNSRIGVNTNNGEITLVFSKGDSKRYMGTIRSCAAPDPEVVTDGAYGRSLGREADISENEADDEKYLNYTDSVFDETEKCVRRILGRCREGHFPAAY